MQYERSTTRRAVAGRDAHVHATRVDPSRALGRRWARRRRRRVRVHRRAAPRPRPSPRRADLQEVGGPADVDLLDAQRGRERRDRFGDAGRARHAHDAGPVGAHAGGDRRTLGAEAHGVLRATASTRTARPCRSASSRAAAITVESTLPPNAPPLASGDAGSPPGHAPRRVGLEVGRLDPRASAACTVQSPCRQLDRMTRRRRSFAAPAPWPRRAAPRRASRPPTNHRGRRGPRRARRRARCRRRSRPPPSATSAATRCGVPALERRPRGCSLEIAGQALTVARRRTRATPRGSCASRCTGTGGRAARARRGRCRLAATPRCRSASRRTMMPGVQNPHWLAPVAAEGLGPHAARVAACPPTVVIDRPATRRAGRHARDPRLAVDEHGAAAALALRAAPVLRRLMPSAVAQHLEQRRTVVGHGRPTGR